MEDDKKSLLEQKKEKARKKVGEKPLDDVYGRKARAFALNVATGLTPVEAARRAGYKDGNYIGKRADELISREDVAVAILKLRQEFSEKLARKGLETIDKHMDSSNERISLDAAKFAITVAGVPAPHRSEKIVAKVPEEVIKSKYKLPE